MRTLPSNFRFSLKWNYYFGDPRPSVTTDLILMGLLWGNETVAGIIQSQRRLKRKVKNLWIEIRFCFLPIGFNSSGNNNLIVVECGWRDILFPWNLNCYYCLMEIIRDCLSGYLSSSVYRNGWTGWHDDRSSSFDAEYNGIEGVEGVDIHFNFLQTRVARWWKALRYLFSRFCDMTWIQENITTSVNGLGSNLHLSVTALNPGNDFYKVGNCRHYDEHACTRNI